VQEWTDWYGRGGTINERSSFLYANTVGHVEEIFEEKFRCKADGALVISQRLFTRLVNLGYPPEQIRLFRYGCTFKDDYNISKGRAKKIQGMPEGVYILTYVGTVMKTDEDLIIETLVRLKEKIRNGMRILIQFVGSELDASKYSLLQRQLPVRFTPRLSGLDYALALSASDLFILPMRLTVANMGRWPSKFSDYCLYGRPIVATAVSDLPEIFAQHNLGYLSSGDSPKEFAESIVTALVNRQDWNEKGHNAKEYAYNYLDWWKVCDGIVSFYKSVVSRACSFGGRNWKEMS